MADEIFENPRLAAIYDALDADRRDLDAYVALADELGARRVLDVGCGTGTFAQLLAGRGLEVTGVDPAKASLDVARGKPAAERVRWIHGTARTVRDLQVDLATMTGNVAQAIADESEWSSTSSIVAVDSVRPYVLVGAKGSINHSPLPSNMQAINPWRASRIGGGRGWAKSRGLETDLHIQYAGRLRSTYRAPGVLFVSDSR